MNMWRVESTIVQSIGGYTRSEKSRKLIPHDIFTTTSDPTQILVKEPCDSGRQARKVYIRLILVARIRKLPLTARIRGSSGG